MRGLAITLLILSLSSSAIVAQSPLLRLDAFFEDLSSDKDVTEHFAKSGMVSSVIYDSIGDAKHVHQTSQEFNAQIDGIRSEFEMRQTPLVLVFREYEHVASLFCSVLIQFKDKQNGKLIEATNMQSIKLVFDDGEWYINQISIQNEHPNFPIDSAMKPESLKNKHRKAVDFFELTQPARPLDDFSTEYDPNKVYKVNEVDQIPEYPLGTGGLNELCEQFNVVSEPTPAYTPFIVTIGEDGQAMLSYTHDLSGFQIAQTESFVRSMMIWYPAVKYAASVKCKLIFYIRA